MFNHLANIFNFSDIIWNHITCKTSSNKNTFLGTDGIPTISSLSLIGSLATKKIQHKCQEIQGHPSPQGI